MTKTDIATQYRRFAHTEARKSSPLYTELALGVADDPALLSLLNTLPPAKQQPNLLFACARLINGTPTGFPQFRTTLLEQWHNIAPQIQQRRTQTNEPARCAALYPLLTALPQPLALIEVGASAGLCLYPDRYAYNYNGTATGDTTSPVHIACSTRGPQPPTGSRLHIASRTGIDLNPLDVRDRDNTSWLRTLVWPEHHHRAARLNAAIDIAAADPPHLIQGDLNERLPEAVAAAPDDATIVVFHTAVMPYLPQWERHCFTEQTRRLGVRWIAQESPKALPHVTAPEPTPRTDAVHLLTQDERPIAHTAPHGGWIRWFD